MYSPSKKNQYVIMGILYLISSILGSIVQYLLLTEHSYTAGLNKYTQECLYSGHSKISKLLSSTRGSDYYLSSEKYKFLDNTPCLVSWWAFTHVILYLFIGFFCPDLFVPSLIIGILFEIGECLFFKCHDILDVFFNSFGFGIGYQINNLFVKNKSAFKPSVFYFFGFWCVLFIYMASKVKNYQENLNMEQVNKVKSY
jgi:hypothetical protein